LIVAANCSGELTAISIPELRNLSFTPGILRLSATISIA
jgi:hypothetical protein